MYWLAQIVGSVSIGFLLDQRALTRRFRAFAGWTALFLMVFVVHIWAYFYQKCVIRRFRFRFPQTHVSPCVRPFRNYTRATIALEAQDDDKIDIYDKPYVGRVFLYIICGMLDAMWQTTAYWIMGAMSNDPAKLANLTGFCESLACVSGVACSFPSPLKTSLSSLPARRASGVEMPSVSRECFHQAVAEQKMIDGLSGAGT